MKTHMQRRGVTSRTKALSGISHKLRDGSEQRNRYNDYMKEDRSYSNSQGPGYRNMERSAWDNNERSRNHYFSKYNDEGYRRPDRRDRFNEYAAHRNQASPHELRYGNENNDEYFYEYLQPRIDRGPGNYYDKYRQQELRSRQYPQEYRHDFESGRGQQFYEPYFREAYSNPYGEHPASRGALEYLGSNKRHSGLGNYEYGDNDFYRAPYQERSDYYSNERYDERNKDRNDHRNNAGLEYRDYMDRGQYERAFHGRETYDPIQSEYDRQEHENYYNRYHPYRHEGYQNFGNTEGFGIRGGGRQYGQDWEGRG